MAHLIDSQGQQDNGTKLGIKRSTIISTNSRAQPLDEAKCYRYGRAH